jgi:hypothetical protein
MRRPVESTGSREPLACDASCRCSDKSSPAHTPALRRALRQLIRECVMPACNWSWSACRHAYTPRAMRWMYPAASSARILSALPPSRRRSALVATCPNRHTEVSGRECTPEASLGTGRDPSHPTTLWGHAARMQLWRARLGRAWARRRSPRNCGDSETRRTKVPDGLGVSELLRFYVEPNAAAARTGVGEGVLGPS